jgi:hypothetical protein
VHLLRVSVRRHAALSDIPHQILCLSSRETQRPSDGRWSGNHCCLTRRTFVQTSRSPGWWSIVRGACSFCSPMFPEPTRASRASLGRCRRRRMPLCAITRPRTCRRAEGSWVRCSLRRSRVALWRSAARRRWLLSVACSNTTHSTPPHFERSVKKTLERLAVGTGAVWPCSGMMSAVAAQGAPLTHSLPDAAVTVGAIVSSVRSAPRVPARRSFSTVRVLIPRSGRFTGSLF